MTRKPILRNEALDQGLEQPPVVEIDWDSHTVDIVDKKQEFWTWKDPYYINFDRFETPEQLLGWILHLSGKKWWSARHVKELIYAWMTFTGKQVDFDA